MPAVVGLAVLGVGVAIAVAVVGYAGVLVEDGAEVQVGVPTSTFVPGTVTEATTVSDGPEDLVHVSAAPAVEVLEEVAGPGVRATQLVIYPEYLVATVEAPGEPGELDRWVLYLGRDPIGPDPQRNVADIDDDLFELAAVDLGLLASLPERAAAELDMGIEAVGYFIVDRRDGELQYRVYASTERHNGFVRFAVDGTVLAVTGG